MITRVWIAAAGLAWVAGCSGDPDPKPEDSCGVGFNPCETGVEDPDTVVVDTDTDGDTEVVETDTDADSDTESPTETGDTDPDTDTDDSPDSPHDSADTDLDTEIEDTDGSVSVSTLAAGQIVITELMVDTASCIPSNSQYIEIRNLSTELVDLTTLELGNTSGFVGITVLTGDLAPGAYAVGVLEAASRCDYGLTPDFSWSTQVWDPDADHVTLRAGAVTFDTVDWDQPDWSAAWPGRAWQALEEDASLNDLRESWCLADPVGNPLGTTDDGGTPGAAADPSACVGDSGGLIDTFDPVQIDSATDDTVVDSDTDTDTDTDTDSETDTDSAIETGSTGVVETDETETFVPVIRDPLDGLQAEELEPGELVITELMIDPTDCSSNDAQYVEVYNASAWEIEPEGLAVVVDGGTPREVDAFSAFAAFEPIQPGEYAVFYRRSFGGYCYTSAHDPTFRISGLTLADAPISLQTPAGDEIDAVDATGWALPSGASLQLAIAPDAATNDDASAWCPSGDAILVGGSDLGSPGFEGSCGVIHTGELETDSDSDTETGGDTGGAPVDPDTLVAGDLVISEVMASPSACSQTAGEFIEIYNPSSNTIEIGGMELVIDGVANTLPGSILSPPGSYRLLARVAQGSFCYDVQVDADWGSTSLSSSGSTITLQAATSGGTLVLDTIDTRVVSPPQTGVTANLDSRFLFANSNDLANNWCLGQFEIQPTTDLGTPRSNNDICAAPVPQCDSGDTACVRGLDSDSDSDGLSTFRVEGTHVDDLLPGDLVITEFMAQPTDCAPDSRAEYIEILNTTTERVDLRHLVIQDEHNASAWHFQTLVEPGGLALAVMDPGSASHCYGIGWDLQLDPVPLDDNGDLIRLVASDGDVIDEVDWREWPILRGASWELDESAWNATDNDDLAMWCPASHPIAGATDRGSPGASSSCLDSPDPVDPTLPAAASVDSLSSGDLRITELLLEGRDCGDLASEYIEILNESGGAVDLYGLFIDNQNNSFLISESVRIEAGDYALGVRGGSPQCHGLDAAFEYGTLLFGDDADHIRIRNATTVIDELDARACENLPSGVSIQLGPGTAHPALLQDWCASTTILSGGTFDRGTPGAANSSCLFPLLCNGVVDTDPDWVDTSDTSLVDLGPTPKELEDARVGDLVITEVMVEPRDCAASTAEYLEITNRSADRIDMNGLQIGHNGTVYQVDRPEMGLVIEPGEALVGIRRSLQACYDDIQVDFRYEALLFDPAGGPLWIASESMVLDVVDLAAVGALGLPAGSAWTVDPAAAVPSAGGVGDDPASAPDFSATYPHADPAEWCWAWDRIGGTLSDHGSPGRDNDVCVADGELPPYPPDHVLSVGELTEGQLVITEVMVDPSVCIDVDGEYIEVVNQAAWAVDLQGMKLVDQDGSEGEVLEGDQVGAGETAVIRRASTADCYPDLEAVAEYTIVSMAVTDGFLRLSSHTTVLDETSWAGGSELAGAARSLAPDQIDAFLNDDEAAWCGAPSAHAVLQGDFGSPGVLNGVCPVVDPGDPVAMPLADVPVGALVITEVLLDNADCAIAIDAAEQYIEIYNTLDEEVSLEGLVVGTPGSYETLSGFPVIAASSYGVISPDLGAQACLGLDPVATFHPSWHINPTGQLSIGYAGQVIDVVTMDDLPATTTQSIQLESDFPNAVENDVGSQWCLACVPIGSAVATFGTPGAPNDCACDSGFVVPNRDTAVDPVQTVFAIGQGTAFPGVVFNGFWTRIAGWMNPATGSQVQGDCGRTWDVSALSAPDVSSLCPSCTFAFEVARTHGYDENLDLYGEASLCTPWWGPGADDDELELITIAFSPSYQTLFTVDGGVLEVYSYQAGLIGTEFSWLRSMSTTVYYP